MTGCGATSRRPRRDTQARRRRVTRQIRVGRSARGVMWLPVIAGMGLNGGGALCGAGGVRLGMP